MVYKTGGMGVRRHRQEGALPPPCGNVKRFCALVVTAKRSVDKLSQRYFHNQTPTGDPSLDPAGGLSSPDP